MKAVETPKISKLAGLLANATLLADLTPKITAGASVKDLQAALKATGRGHFRSRDEATKAIVSARRLIGRAKPAAHASSVRARCEELLTYVDAETNLGWSYAAIVATIQDERPKASTSMSSVRWYAGQMKLRGETLPERPRSV